MLLLILLQVTKEKIPTQKHARLYLRSQHAVVKYKNTTTQKGLQVQKEIVTC
jgi:hypothetical protein